MKDNTKDSIAQLLGVFTVVLVVSWVAVDVYTCVTKKPSLPEPTNLEVKIESRAHLETPEAYFEWVGSRNPQYPAWFVDFDSWLDTRVFDELTHIFSAYLPDKPLDYCKALAVTAINQIHGEHTKYTVDIYKHNPETIDAGIETLKATEED